MTRRDHEELHESRPATRDLRLKGNIVCDLDGVVYRGEAEVNGAGRALSLLADAGYRIIFATNNSSRTDAEVAAKIEGASGYPASIDQIVTSARAAAVLLGSDPLDVYVVGGEGLRVAVAEAGHEVVSTGRAAQAVVMGFDPLLTYDRIKEATIAVRNGARFIASNLDTTLPVAGDGIWPGAGSLVAAVEAASARTAEPAGKPFAPMRGLIETRLGPGPVWAVGDRPETDLELGRRAGWTTVLVLSGVTGVDAAEQAGADLMLSSIADLPAALSAI